MTNQAQVVIDQLKGKGGESYSGNGRHGWRNPIRSDTGDLLYALILAAMPNRVLELGTAYGLSGLYIASALGDKHFDTIEFDFEVAKEAHANFEMAGFKNVTVYPGDISQVFTTFDMVYDCVFFDAEKKLYFRHLMELRDLGLISKGCLILADNVIDRKKEMEDFLAYISSYPHSIVQTECGLLVARL